jgi:hypothetical protein
MRSAVRCSIPAADSSGRHVAGGGVTGIPVTRKALGTEKETAEAEEIMVARVKKKMEGKHRDQQRHNEISTPIQPQHLSNESARLKRLMGQGKNFFFGFCGLSELKKNTG